MEGSYDWIAEKVFPTLDVDTLYVRKSEMILIKLYLSENVA